MISAMWRKLRADIMTNKLQFFLIWGVLALSAMLLTISLLVMDSTDEPWDRTFEATNAPHVWVVSHQHDVDFSLISEHEAVAQSTDRILALAENPLVMEDEKISMFFYAMDEPPQVGHPLVAEGRWLEPGMLDEVVLDFSLARYYDLQVGDEVVVLAADGNHPLIIVGLAVTAHWFPYDEITKDVSPGVAYISGNTLEGLQPDYTYWYSVVGLRLHEPDTSKAFVDQVYETLPGKLRSVIEWQFVKENAALANTINVMFMGLFSMLGLTSVGMIIFNTLGGQIISQYKEIGFLKAAGFKPNQVTALFLIEHVFIGLMAAIPGLIAGLVIAPSLISPLADNLNTTPPDLYAPASLIIVLMLVVGMVILATLLPAWQGGRINTVQAITVGYRRRPRRPSLFARMAGWLHLPTVVVLGVKDTFSRPLRTIIAIASLVLTVLVAISSVAAQDATNVLGQNRMYFNGTSADMIVNRNFVPSDGIKEILSHPTVMDTYQELPLWGQAMGHGDQPIFIRLLSADYQNFDFQLKEGHMFAASGEAVAGHAILELLGVQIGDTLELSVEGEPIELTIVGRYAEAFNNNNVIITSLETYRGQVDPDALPQTYYLRLDDYGQAESLRTEWLDEFRGLIDVRIVTDEAQESMLQLKNLIAGFGLILMIVAGANLMSTSLLSIRERLRDFGIQKTLGLTPGQIAISVVVGTITVALLALLLGIGLGVWLLPFFFARVWMEIGAGPDLYIMGWNVLSPLLPIIVLLAILSSLIPAIRAARLGVTEALKYE